MAEGTTIHQRSSAPGAGCARCGHIEPQQVADRFFPATCPECGTGGMVALCECGEPHPCKATIHAAAETHSARMDDDAADLLRRIKPGDTGYVQGSPRAVSRFCETYFGSVNRRGGVIRVSGVPMRVTSSAGGAMLRYEPAR